AGSLVVGFAPDAAVIAEARGDDPDVNVVDGIELALETFRAVLVRRLRLRARRDALRVQAKRVYQALDEVRHCVAQDFLLVGHRSGVVDSEEQVDLVDASGELLGHDRSRPRVDRLDRSIQATPGEQATRRDRDPRVRDSAKTPTFHAYFSLR